MKKDMSSPMREINYHYGGGNVFEVCYIHFNPRSIYWLYFNLTNNPPKTITTLLQITKRNSKS